MDTSLVDFLWFRTQMQSSPNSLGLTHFPYSLGLSHCPSSSNLTETCSAFLPLPSLSPFSHHCSCLSCLMSCLFMDMHSKGQDRHQIGNGPQSTTICTGRPTPLWSRSHLESGFRDPGTAGPQESEVKDDHICYTESALDLFWGSLYTR